MNPTHFLPSNRATSTRRVDGKPETDADRRLSDLRAAGYRGPIDQDGHAVAELAIPTGGPDFVATSGMTLRAAALYLDRYGWCQGSYYLPSATVFTPPADMVGAIGVVCYGGPVDAPAQHFDAPGWAAFEAAVTCLDGYLSDRFDGDAYTFNDAAGRTAEDVRRALLRAAWLHDGRRLTPVCCERLMVEQPGSPAVFPPDGHGRFAVSRMFRCSVCDRIAVREVFECATEWCAAERALAARPGLLPSGSDATPGGVA
jgi:hypothetical protein